MIAMLVLLVLILKLLVVYSTGHLLETRLGQLEGIQLPARYNKTYIAYFGVPYAKPPIGNLRFKPPVKADKWNGTLNATQIPEECSQVPKTETEYAGVEDCLYVHVFTPQNAKAGSNLPVIFYIFGGMFKQGNATREGPQYFMSREIILVMVSYRLGALGFLSTGDSVVPGNMGMKDQVLALKWTNEYIYDFGGDQNRVTIMGHSSGAACVHLHTLSPLSKDYFHRAIMQSGLAINPHFYMAKDTAKSLTLWFGERMNCSIASSKALIQCLKTKSVEEIVLVASNLTLWQQEPSTVFRPTFEDENVENAFLTENALLAPYTSIEKPWLLGMTSGEAANYISAHLQEATYTADPNQILPIWGLFFFTAKPSHIQYIQQVIKTKFFDDQNKMAPSIDKALVDALTGIMHGMGLLDVLHQYRGPKYLYLYDYRAGYSNNEEGMFRGVAHADEVAIMWHLSISGLNPLDLPFADEMITRWVNFAHSGDPNVPYPINTKFFGRWNPVLSSHLEYLHIAVNGTMKANYFTERFGFWKKLPFFSKYL